MPLPRHRARKEWQAAADDAITFTRTGASQGQWYHHKLGVGGDLFDLVAIAFCGRPLGQKSAPGDFPKILKAAAECVGYDPATTPLLSPEETVKAHIETQWAELGAATSKGAAGHRDPDGHPPVSRAPHRRHPGGPLSPVTGDCLLAYDRARLSSALDDTPLRYTTGPGGWRTVWCVDDLGGRPDQDPPDSPAARTFQRAAIQHLENGHDLWIARAPESEGSKKDLNDTLRERGITAVHDAISAAQPLTETAMEADNGEDKDPIGSRP